ncbi:MAG: hypothetical protein ACRCR9_04180, partial [Chitinophagaceae bacterium]
MIFHLKVKIIFITLVLVTFFLHLGCTKKNAHTEIEDENNTKPPIEARIFISPTAAKIGDSIKIHIPKQIEIEQEAEALKVSFKSSQEDNPEEASIGKDAIKVSRDEEHTILHVKLPDALATNAYTTITVTYNKNGDTVTYKEYPIWDDESIKNVVILDEITTPIDLKKSDEITIKGKNFSKTQNENTIVFLKDNLTLDNKLEPSIKDDTTLTFKIPETIIRNVKDETGTRYFIRVKVSGKTNLSNGLPLTIKNSEYPTFSEVEYSPDEKNHGTSFKTNNNWENSEIVEISNTVDNKKAQLKSGSENRMYFPDDMPAGKYYLKVKQNNHWLTAIDKDTKDSTIEVKPYITNIKITDEHGNEPIDYNDEGRSITIEGANLTYKKDKLAFTLTTSDGPHNDNFETDDPTKVTYPNFSKGLPAGGITITIKNADAECIKEETLTFYKP